jgi:hypothetical protein
MLPHYRADSGLSPARQRTQIIEAPNPMAIRRMIEP